MGRTKYDHPESLRDVRVDFYAILDPIIQEKEGTYDCQVIYDPESLVEQILDQDVYRLSDRWFGRFTGGIYFGIMSAYPWYESCPIQDEESMWAALLKYHGAFKKGDLVFKYNPKSPIDKWLRKHTSDGDTPINVETLFRFAVKSFLEHYEFNLEPYESEDEDDE